MPLDPGTKAMLDLIAAAGYPPMQEGSPEDGRKAMRAMTSDLVDDATRIPVGSVRDLEAGGVPARLYLPEGAGPWPTLVYLHGGGFVIGDLETHDQTCRRFCGAGELAVLSVDYRLAPEAPYPAAVDDALAAVGWAAEHLDDLGGGAMLAVGGDSAGGTLAAVAAQTFRDRVGAQVLIYPAVHVLGDYASRAENGSGYFLDTPMMEWFMGHYVGGVDSGVDLDDLRLSPLLGDLPGLPPAIVVTAEFDPLRDEGEAYAAALAAAGVPVEGHRYDGLVHGFIDMGPASPAADAALGDVVARAARLLHGAPVSE